MPHLFCRKHLLFCRKAISIILIATFGLSVVVSPSGAQLLPNLPAPGQMVWLTAGFQPPVLRGMTVHPENPLLFDFIVDRGQDKINNDLLKDESTKLIKYFLTSMTIPDKDAWVNLSPYEKDRIIPDALGQTEMGRQMLEQDYMLKQLAASLTNPDTELGKKYWDEIHRLDTLTPSSKPLTPNQFNKVWIVPNGATVVEKDGFAYITESKLNVMLDEEYTVIASISTQVFREMILPKLVEEVNTGKSFAPTRQVYQSVILAAWYKKALQDSLLGRIYANKSKVAGVESDVKDIKQKVYEQYLEAFKKGAYNIIKEDASPNGDDPIPRKYFSGGEVMRVDNLTVDQSSSAVNRVAAEINIAQNQLALVAASGVETRQEADAIFESMKPIPTVNSGSDRLNWRSWSARIAMVLALNAGLTPFNMIDNSFAEERIVNEMTLSQNGSQIIFTLKSSKQDDLPLNIVNYSVNHLPQEIATVKAQYDKSAIDLGTYMSATYKKDSSLVTFGKFFYDPEYSREQQKMKSAEKELWAHLRQNYPARQILINDQPITFHVLPIEGLLHIAGNEISWQASLVPTMKYHFGEGVKDSLIMFVDAQQWRENQSVTLNNVKTAVVSAHAKQIQLSYDETISILQELGLTTGLLGLFAGGYYAPAGARRILKASNLEGRLKKWILDKLAADDAQLISNNVNQTNSDGESQFSNAETIVVKAGKLVASLTFSADPYNRIHIKIHHPAINSIMNLDILEQFSEQDVDFAFAILNIVAAHDLTPSQRIVYDRFVLDLQSKRRKGVAYALVLLDMLKQNGNEQFRDLEEFYVKAYVYLMARLDSDLDNSISQNIRDELAGLPEQSAGYRWISSEIFHVVRPETGQVSLDPEQIMPFYYFMRNIPETDSDWKHRAKIWIFERRLAALAQPQPLNEAYWDQVKNLLRALAFNKSFNRVDFLSTVDDYLSVLPAGEQKEVFLYLKDIKVAIQFLNEPFLDDSQAEYKRSKQQQENYHQSDLTYLRRIDLGSEQSFESEEIIADLHSSQRVLEDRLQFRLGLIEVYKNLELLVLNQPSERSTGYVRDFIMSLEKHPIAVVRHIPREKFNRLMSLIPQTDSRQEILKIFQDLRDVAAFIEASPLADQQMEFKENLKNWEIISQMPESFSQQRDIGLDQYEKILLPIKERMTAAVADRLPRVMGKIVESKDFRDIDLIEKAAESMLLYNISKNNIFAKSFISLWGDTFIGIFMASNSGRGHLYAALLYLANGNSQFPFTTDNRNLLKKLDVPGLFEAIEAIKQIKRNRNAFIASEKTTLYEACKDLAIAMRTLEQDKEIEPLVSEVFYTGAKLILGTPGTEFLSFIKDQIHPQSDFFKELVLEIVLGQPSNRPLLNDVFVILETRPLSRSVEDLLSHLLNFGSETPLVGLKPEGNNSSVTLKKILNEFKAQEVETYGRTRRFRLPDGKILHFKYRTLNQNDTKELDNEVEVLQAIHTGLIEVTPQIKAVTPQALIRDGQHFFAGESKDGKFTTGIIYIADEDYFTYITDNDSIRKKFRNSRREAIENGLDRTMELARALWEQGVFMDETIYHRDNVFNWFDNNRRVGSFKLEQIKDWLKYPNISVSGMRDFGHFDTENQKVIELIGNYMIYYTIIAVGSFYNNGLRKQEFDTFIRAEYKKFGVELYAGFSDELWQLAQNAQYEPTQKIGTRGLFLKKPVYDAIAEVGRNVMLKAIRDKFKKAEIGQDFKSAIDTIGKKLKVQENNLNTTPLVNDVTTESASSSVGGIDFDPSKLNLQIKRDGHGVPLPLPQQNLENINIDGLYPVIINILPINAQTLPILGQLNIQQDVILSKN